MTYVEFLSVLEPYRDEKYAKFHQKLLANTSQTVLGVRAPQLRKIAKSALMYLDELFTFPDTYYEVTFVKLTAVSLLDFPEFIKWIDHLVPLIENWATCDGFKPKCLQNHREEFLPYIQKYFDMHTEFGERYALVTLLNYYVEENYLGLIKEYILTANTQFYYVHMAVAWLVAEILAKHYDFGVTLLQDARLDAKTRNKAIQKARESFRIDNEKKEFLNSLKIKNKSI
jgi:3-methyladenine DNA glycosylase AlkD